MNQSIPCITFDQPLFLKAMCIIKAEKLPVVCRLGGFHTLMSFLGSIGVLMQGSWLKEVFEEVYARNSVVPERNMHGLSELTYWFMVHCQYFCCR